MTRQIGLGSASPSRQIGVKRASRDRSEVRSGSVSSTLVTDGERSVPEANGSPIGSDVSAPVGGSTDRTGPAPASDASPECSNCGRAGMVASVVTFDRDGGNPMRFCKRCWADVATDPAALASRSNGLRDRGPRTHS